MRLSLTSRLDFSQNLDDLIWSPTQRKADGQTFGVQWTVHGANTSLTGDYKENRSGKPLQKAEKMPSDKLIGREAKPVSRTLEYSNGKLNYIRIHKPI